MTDTLPPRGSNSSTSAALQSFLESRLQTRLEKAGSTIYSMRWSEKATPAGRRYCQLVASARRISASDCSLVQSGWNTPKATETMGRYGITNGKAYPKLWGQALLTGWPTPTVADDNMSRMPDPQTFSIKRLQRANVGTDLAVIVQAHAGWPTPTTRDHKDGEAPSVVDTTRTDLLPHAVMQTKAQKPIRITGSGLVLTGLDAGTVSSGQLSPAHSRWLMGYPPEWDDCAVTAMPSSRK